jgi:myo-inositol-1(or 4)-monophosphatase
MIDLKEITLEVCRIAVHTGSFLRHERENFELAKVEQKHDHDYVSYVDKQSEKLLVDALSKIPIPAGFVTEEKTASYNNEDYCWIIDPLDGTTNYIHNYLPYAISIGLKKGEEMVVGVVYEVTKDECYYAWKEGGAFMNGQSITVNKSDNIDKALICLELPYDHNKYKKFGIELINYFYGIVGGIRMNGSAATALCYVAAGKLDGWIEKFIGQWDIAAGTLIVKEAGGKVTNFSGSETYIDDNNIVATNMVIHDNLLSAIANHIQDIK